jgi:hypothetical protein
VLTPRLAFWRDNHVWFVLTDPLPGKGKVLCVSLTTLDAECADDECVLDASDYGWIKHQTAAAFSFARIWDVQKLDLALQRGLLKVAHPSHLSASTFDKIRAVALKSIYLDAEQKALL